MFKWGIIGPGRIAHRFAEGLGALEEAELYAVASRNAERGSAFARQYHADKEYTSYEELVNDPAVDAVYIATPHRFHHEQTRLCLEAGKPVLCEKPLTVNAQEAQDLFTLAEAKNLFLMEALWTRFLPIYQQVRRWLDENTIGDVIYAHSTFGFKVARDEADRLLNPELAGGVLLDMGVYNIAVSQWVFSKNPISVKAQGLVGPTGVDELINASLQYDEGQFAQFACNFRTNTKNDFTIYGSRGYIRIHEYFWDATRATLTVDGNETTIEAPFAATGFEYQTEESMQCIRTGKQQSSIMPWADTLANMQLIDTIRQQLGVRFSFEG